MESKYRKSYFGIEDNKIYSVSTKLFKNPSPFFLSIRRRCEKGFYMFGFSLGTNPKVSEEIKFFEGG